MITENKIVERVRKLLALAASGSGATEAEAQSAAAKAAEIMEEAGLTAMAVEMAGGEGEGRSSDKLDVGHESWHESLMAAVSESCFCWHEMTRTGKRSFSFRLIGRRSGTITAASMFEYLRKTIWALSRQADIESPHYFRCGMAERIAERIVERHATRLQDQQREARERSRSAASSSGSNQQNALVVTLVDHEQRERDLNEDFRNGLKPGTTEQRRRDVEARSAAAAQKIRDLVASGVSDGVAFNMVHLGHSRERAEAYEREWLADQEKIAKKNQRRSSWTKGDEERWLSHQRKENRKSSSSWKEGRSTGDQVGLETQINRNSATKQIN